MKPVITITGTSYTWMDGSYWANLDPRDVTVPEYIEGQARGTMKRHGRFILRKLPGTPEALHRQVKYESEDLLGYTYDMAEDVFWERLDPKTVTIPQFIEGRARGTMKRHGKWILRRCSQAGQKFPMCDTR